MSGDFKDKQKSIGVAYTLLFLFGAVGLHRFYLGNRRLWIVYPILLMLSYVQPWVFMIFSGMIIFDIFLIPNKLLEPLPK